VMKERASEAGWQGKPDQDHQCAEEQGEESA